MKDIMHELIIVISNQGHIDEIMKTAKSNGARGGTIIHGKGTADAETARFFGLKLHPEKELLLIVTPKELTTNLLKSISEKHGVHTETRALCFALPVSKVSGFNFD